MGRFMPTLMAFLLNSCGIFIFEDASKAGCEPLVSSLIFLFSIFLLLWEIKIYPASLRSLWYSGASMLQFFISAFIMEHAMNSFWFPLESSLFHIMPKVADYENNFLRQFGWRSPGFLRLMKCHIVQVLASYALSTFFLICVLHSTRMIDLGLLRCGKSVFIEDVAHRMRKNLRKVYKRLSKRRNNCCKNMGYSDGDDDYDHNSGDSRTFRRRSH